MRQDRRKPNTPSLPCNSPSPVSQSESVINSVLDRSRPDISSAVSRPFSASGGRGAWASQVLAPARARPDRRRGLSIPGPCGAPAASPVVWCVSCGLGRMSGFRTWSARENPWVAKCNTRGATPADSGLEGRIAKPGFGAEQCSNTLSFKASSGKRVKSQIPVEKVAGMATGGPCVFGFLCGWCCRRRGSRESARRLLMGTLFAAPSPKG